MAVVEAKQGDFTFQSSAAANGNGNVFDNSLLQFGLLVIHIVGTGFTGIVNFEATGDKAASPAFVALLGEKVADGTTGTSSTNPSSEMWRFDIAGMRQVRIRVSGFAAGSVSVFARVQSF